MDSILEDGFRPLFGDLSSILSLPKMLQSSWTIVSVPSSGTYLPFQSTKKHCAAAFLVSVPSSGTYLPFKEMMVLHFMI